MAAPNGAPAGAITVASAQVVLPCAADLQDTLGFFARFGFAVESIFPADDPRVGDVRGPGGMRVRFDKGFEGPPGRLRLLVEGAAGREEQVAPNGTVLELAPAEEPLAIPDLEESLVISRSGDWVIGRAGMRYRDLIPGRLGGRFITSLIHIPDGGPVPDYVHFHDVRLQFIYVVQGWVRVVYEDQGEPTVMRAGDCVLQPPKIRHRVLESSPDLYVCELGCPAEHVTHADPSMELPTGKLDPDRDFGGQRFCLHVAAGATPVPWRHPGFDALDTGIGAATSGLGGVRTVRPRGATATPRGHHQDEYLFSLLTKGSLTLRCEGRPDERLSAFEAFTLPSGTVFELVDIAQDAEWLEASLPANISFVPASSQL